MKIFKYLILLFVLSCSNEKKSNYSIHIDLEVLTFYKSLNKLHQLCDSSSLITDNYLETKQSLLEEINLLIIKMIEASGGYSEAGAKHFELYGFLDHRLIMHPENKFAVRQIFFDEDKFARISDLFNEYDKELPLDFMEILNKKFNVENFLEIEPLLVHLMTDKNISEVIFLLQTIMDAILKVELIYIMDNCDGCLSENSSSPNP